VSWSNIIILFYITVLIGCSYSTKRYVAPQEDLAKYSYSSNRVMATEGGKDSFLAVGDSVNDLIIQAIFYESKGDYKRSNRFYNTLYNRTNGLAYLIKELTTALYADLESSNVKRLEELVEREPNNIQYKRILLSFYINNRDIDRGKRLADELLNISKMAIDYELSASPYIINGEYQKAVELLTEAYGKGYNEDILLKITTLYGTFLKRIDIAIEKLEDYRERFGCSPKVCTTLLEIYSKEEKIEPLIEIYKALYDKTKIKIYATKMVEGYIFIGEYDKAISILKGEYRNDELLYEVYLAKSDYRSAFKIAEKLYRETKKPRWLAESAMALYEASPDKSDREMLKEFVRRFETALNEGSEDSVYLNYYGYTLIDKDLDVEGGMELIKRALKHQPDNSYYLDSLAWGYYKLNMCDEALRTMKRVVDMEGLSEKEIATHWRAIQKCSR